MEPAPAAVCAAVGGAAAAYVTKELLQPYFNLSRQQLMRGLYKGSGPWE